MTRFAISLDGASLRLHVPSAREGSDLEYSITFPCTSQGAKALRRAIMERQVKPHGLLGTDASPTQQMVEAWLAEDAHEITRANGTRASKIEAVAATIDVSSLDLSL